MENSKDFLVKVIKGGPYAITGSFKLILPSGEEQVTTNAHLCRCGQSKNKPFCDGSHAQSSFDK